MDDTQTPRTDKLVEQWDYSPIPKVMEAHARQLERDLSAANERIRRLEVAGDRMNAMLERDGWDSVGQMMWAKAKEALP